MAKLVHDLDVDPPQIFLDLTGVDGRRGPLMALPGALLKRRWTLTLAEPARAVLLPLTRRNMPLTGANGGGDIWYWMAVQVR